MEPGMRMEIFWKLSRHLLMFGNDKNIFRLKFVTGSYICLTIAEKIKPNCSNKKAIN